MRKTIHWFAFLLMTSAITSLGAERFSDVTAASGLKVGRRAHAVAVEDFDGDGKLDVIVCCFDAPHVQFFRNQGNLRFVDATKGSGLETFNGAGTGIAVGDYDRDGNLDIYLASLRAGQSRLFRGTGGGKFVDVSRKSRTLVPSPCRSCAWSDVDGDGWLDLYVTAPGGSNHLFKNDRQGSFTDIAAEAGVALKGRHSLGCAFGDFDGDGWDDLFVTSYDSQVSALLKNVGGKFRDVTAAAGLGRKASAVGCAFADVMNRGRLDLFVTTDSWMSGENATERQLLRRGRTVEPNALFESLSQGRFAMSQSPALRFKALSHDMVLEDLDHDGLIDIYVAVDATSTAGRKYVTDKGGNPLWTRPDGKNFVEAAKEWGLKHEANCVCAAAADFDNDGDLDLLLVNYYSNVVLYRNNVDDKNWLKIKPVGTKSNLNGIGAKVRLLVERDGKRELIATRHVQSGAGYCRCSPLEVHFGLGKNAAANYRVEVLFPGSKVPVALDGVKPARRIVIQEPRDD